MDDQRLKYEVECAVLLKKYATAFNSRQPLNEWTWEQRAIRNEITNYVKANFKEEWYVPFTPPGELGK